MKDTVLHSHLDRIHPFQTHLTTSFTVYFLPDLVWLHHYHPSSLCLGSPCSSLLTSTWAAVLHWKWLSFLPLSGEHLHSLLFDKTHAPGNQYAQVLHHAILFSTSSISLYTLHCLSCCRKRWRSLLSPLSLSHTALCYSTAHAQAEQRVKHEELEETVLSWHSAALLPLPHTHTHCSHSLHSSPVNTNKLWPEREIELNMCAPVLL